MAEELAAHFPQVSVRRHRQRRGLGSVIDYAQRRVRSDAIIMHDGVTPIDSSEIKSLWRSWSGETAADKAGGSNSSSAKGPMSELANLASIHAAMERAHGRILGFQMVEPLPFDEAFAEWDVPAAANTLRNDSPRTTKPGSIGEIPALPRPKFLRAIANFALGE